MQAREALYKKKKTFKRKFGDKFGIAGAAIGGVADKIGVAGHVIGVAGSAIGGAADSGLGAVTGAITNTIGKAIGKEDHRIKKTHIDTDNKE